jgi:hypothetical protein
MVKTVRLAADLRRKAQIEKDKDQRKRVCILQTLFFNAASSI